MNIRYSIPIFPVIRFDSGIIILESESFDAFMKHSSNVLHGITFALGSIDKAAKCEYAPYAVSYTHLRAHET